jgi:hypothetical protein
MGGHNGNRALPEASTDVWPAAASATVFARIVPRAVSTPATRPPSLRTNPVTSQCSTMSTPWRSAPRANAHATLSWRATPPRRCRVAPRTGYRASGETFTIGQNSLTCDGSSHSASTPFSRFACTRRIDVRTSPRSCARFSTPRWLNWMSKSSASSSPSHSLSECS